MCLNILYGLSWVAPHNHLIWASTSHGEYELYTGQKLESFARHSLEIAGFFSFSGIHTVSCMRERSKIIATHCLLAPRGAWLAGWLTFYHLIIDFLFLGIYGNTCSQSASQPASWAGSVLLSTSFMNFKQLQGCEYCLICNMGPCM